MTSGSRAYTLRLNPLQVKLALKVRNSARVVYTGKALGRHRKLLHLPEAKELLPVVGSPGNGAGQTQFRDVVGECAVDNIQVGRC